MAMYHGRVRGSAMYPATRCGTKASGLETVAACLDGAIRVTLHWDSELGRTMVRVVRMPWQGSDNVYEVLFCGSIERLDSSPPSADDDDDNYSLGVQYTE